MVMVRNLSRVDRALRVGLGIGIAGIVVSHHPHVGRAMGFAEALVSLSGASGT